MELKNIVSKSKGKVVYRDGDNCVKVFDTDYSKADVLNEALNQARVEGVGINIPRIHEVMMVDGKWAIISDFIEGKTLQTLMEENPDSIDEYLEIFVNLQLKILECRSPLLKRLKDKMADKIDRADLDSSTKFELQTRLAGMPKHYKLCHGDFNPSNVIIRTDGTPFVVDWAHATQGNGSADAARSYLLFCLYGKQDIGDKYLSLFCEKSGTDKKYVQKWMPIVAASQSVKNHEEEREFLMSWATVAEYQ